MRTPSRALSSETASYSTQVSFGFAARTAASRRLAVASNPIFNACLAGFCELWDRSQRGPLESLCPPQATHQITETILLVDAVAGERTERSEDPVWIEDLVRRDLDRRRRG